MIFLGQQKPVWESAPRGRHNQPIKAPSATDGERAQVLIRPGEI